MSSQHYTHRIPLFNAAMAGVAGGQMAAEMVRAGAFGFIAANGTSTSHVEQELGVAREILQQPNGRMAKLGLGVLCWKLEEAGKEAQAEELLRLACQNVSAIWLAFGRQLERWVKLVRVYGGEDIKIYIAVTSVDSAIAAAQVGADVLIVQGAHGCTSIGHASYSTGFEAGGHGAAQGQPLFSLLPLVALALREKSLDRPLLAAGGLVHPSQVAAALMLDGCVGAVLGTALLATSASGYSAAQKSLIASARSTGPRSMLYDRLRGQLDWPDGVDGRGLENAWSKEQLQDLSDAELKRRFDEASKEGDPDRMITWAGTSVGLVTSETSLAKVVDDIEVGIREAQRRLNALL